MTPEAVLPWSRLFRASALGLLHKYQAIVDTPEMDYEIRGVVASVIRKLR
ncbi:hypothetical protein [Desulfonatronum parangueonense]